ncbi:MAG: 50S ribosomal protein L4 [Verrucomicrobiales bacterium]
MSVFTMDQAAAAEITVVPGKQGAQAVHDVVTAYRANRRSGTASTKTRGEVKGSNAKPWRQKGTGRARAGRVSSPIWRGGGIVFGPRPRSYAKSVNKPTRKLAFRAALGARIEAGDVITVDDFAVTDGKTKSFISQIIAVAGTHKVIIVGGAFDDQTYLAGRNVGASLLMTADEVNVEHLLRYDKIVLTSSSFPILSRRTQK